ncbi:MAG: PIG-L deacetylase family protein [Nostocoides sp.]
MKALALPADGPLRVLALGAHCDDIELGCGGTLLTLIQARPDTQVAAVTFTSTPQRAAEMRASMAQLCAPVNPDVRIETLTDTRLPGAFDEVKNILAGLADEPWDLVLAPHPNDAHQDHALLGTLVPTAFRDHLVLHYELAKWDGDLGRLEPNVYVPLGKQNLTRRWQVIDSCYSSQRSHDWWDPEVFAGLARLRGMECRSRYAEAFRAAKLTLSLGPGENIDQEQA